MKLMIWTTTVFALLLGLFTEAARADQVFNLYFDGNDFHLGDPYPPIFGTGTVTLTDPVADGTYSLASLSGYTMSFSIFGIDWTEADSVTDPSNVDIVVYGGGTGLYFTDHGDFGPVFNGSFDLVNSDDYLLSFSPSYYLPYTVFFIEDLWFEEDLLYGTYGSFVGTAPVPEPSSFLLAGVGGIFASVVVIRGKRRRTLQAEC